MKNYLKILLKRQKIIKEKLGWKKYIIGLLIAGYLTFTIGTILITLLKKEVIFLIISEILMVIVFIFLINKHFYEFTIKNDNSRYKRSERNKEISWLDVS